MHNLTIAFRTLFKTPFVTAVAALSLALGIGANTAIFSLFDEMLRRPLPVHAPERLVNLAAPGPKPGSTSCNQAGSCEDVFSYPMFRDLERNSGPLSGVAGHLVFGANLAYDKQTLSADGAMVSGGYFPILGLQPFRGRLLGPDDDKVVNANFVAVLSHAFWSSRLGGDPSVVGRQIVLNGQSLTVVGIAPEGFDGTVLGSRASVFVPLSMRGILQGWTGQENRRDYWVYAFGRLKPGMSLEQAKVALNGIYRPIINDVEAPLQNGMSDQTMKRFRAKQLTVEDGRRGQSSIHREGRAPILLLFAITGIVLLIACANIANLLLARAAGREMEMAIRLSLGGTRRQLLAQLLTESVVLAIIGGAFSLLVAQWTLAGLVALLPPEASTSMNLSMSWSAVYFAGAVSVVTGLLFGLFPALHATRGDLVTALRNNSGKLSGGRAASRFRTTLVTAQIALSMSLLIAAGLFIRSLTNVSRVDLGIDVNNVVVFTISPSRNGYDSTRSKALYARLEQELAALPGVTNVASGAVPLLSGNNWGNRVKVEGFQDGPDVDAGSSFNMVSPAYFRTLGIDMLSGREFTEADELGRPRVVVVNEAFAKKFGLGRDAVGRRMTNNDSGPMDMEIVGLIRNAAYSDVKDSTPPQFFTPYRQARRVGRLNFYVRTAGTTDQLLRAIPPLIKRLDANLPVEDLKTLPQQVKENVFLDRMISILSSAFALVATLLAAVGLYGVLAYSIAQRTREIGVRMALGASSTNVRAMVLRQVGFMTLIGGVIGIAGAIGLGRGAKSLLYQISGYDPIVMGASVILLALVALSAGYLPAVKASRVDPMNALRYE